MILIPNYLPLQSQHNNYRPTFSKSKVKESKEIQSKLHSMVLTQWTMGHPTDVFMRSVLSLVSSQMYVRETYQMIPNKSISFGPVPGAQQRRNMDVKKTSQRQVYLQTDAFLASNGRPFKGSMDFILSIP